MLVRVQVLKTMMNISNSVQPLYVYLQLPDDGKWVVVGRYKIDQQTGAGLFRYADSYLASKHAWAIDPVNLPLMSGEFRQSVRYQGLHDVLRDAGPDSWGQAIIRRAHDLPSNSPPVRYLRLSGNGDRWGALAVGSTAKPSIAELSSPRLHQLQGLVDELHSIVHNLPPVNATLRKHLFGTPSLGGARPKATLQDGGEYWLIKPGLATDTVDLALLEHATQRWGNKAGLKFAHTEHHPMGNNRSVVRVLRFDRVNGRRIMALSGATLLGVAYPPTLKDDSDEASYPRLAEELRRIGAPRDDWMELFDRMVFNAVVGNDDDHPRNHAVIFDKEAKCWRLSPAFDVVPNPDEKPRRLAMQPSVGNWTISRTNLLIDFSRFGFTSIKEAEQRLDSVLTNISTAFHEIASILSPNLHQLMLERLTKNIDALKNEHAPIHVVTENPFHNIGDEVADQPHSMI